jgi:hypothetical protein
MQLRKPVNPQAMPRKDRLRRVGILCTNIARNLAYYRVGRKNEHSQMLHPAQNASAKFWRAVNANFIDMCVLEWCKLFADKKDKHHWANIVTRPDDFHAALLNHLGLDEAEFQEQIAIVRRYRDKFLAHLDSDYVMNIPALEIPKKAAWFYYAHVLNNEVDRGDMAGFPKDINRGYEDTEREAEEIYRRINMPLGRGE